MNYIYCTLTADQYYILAKDPVQNDKQTVTKPVSEFAFLVKGGANITDKRLVTPRGVVTQCSDDELACLEKISAFRNHKDGGFIKVEKQQKNIEAGVKDMTGKDQSAPPNEKELKDKVRNAGVKSDAVKITNNKVKAS